MELAISYKRFSGPAQARGRSEGRQSDETETYCTRKGYKLTETYVDRGLSAYTGENSDRGDLKAIMDLARAGRIKRGTIFYPRGGTCRKPELKGLTIMVNSIYNGWRYEDAWLDR
jgi:hypothetical protein